MNQEFKTLLNKASTLGQKMKAIKAINAFMHTEQKRLALAMPSQSKGI